MNFLPVLVIFVSVIELILGNDINAKTEVSYEDLKALNMSCYPKDSCMDERPNYSPEIAFPYSCSCHRDCSKLGTCCIDSPYRDDSTPTQQCRTVDSFPTSFGYYMIHRCPSNTDNNSIWKTLCEKEWDKEDDVLKIAPVTSLDTNVTYKNYYCFRCHETTDKFLYWELHLLGDYRNSGIDLQDRDFSVTYNQTNEIWLASMVNEGVSIPVKLKFVSPKEIKFSIIECNPRIISSCSDNWKDAYVRDMCNSYTALLYRTFGAPVKNVHCALCSFQSLDEFICEKPKTCILCAIGISRKVFSFSRVINVNRSGGESVEEIAKCGANQSWDPYGHTCRNLTCALPWKVIKDNQCTSP